MAEKNSGSTTRVRPSSAGNGEPDNAIEVVPCLTATERLVRQLQSIPEIVEQAKSELVSHVKSNKLQSEINRLQQTLKSEWMLHQKEVDTYKDIEQKLGQDLIQIQHTLDAKAKELQTLQRQLKERNTTQTQYDHQNLESARKAFDLQRIIDQQNQKIVNYKSSLEAEKLTTEKLKAELEEAKTGKMMSPALADNNPNVTELSDKNRPSKIGERYQELYDNQWTDAFETVEKAFPKITEKDIVSVLLKILLAVQQFCEETASRYKVKMMRALYTSDQKSSKPIPDYVNKALNDCRKAMAPENVEFVYEGFLGSTSKATSRGKLTHRLSSYVKECVELCWLMTLQDPPVVFGPNVTSMSPFDTNVYRPYTTSGSMIDFVVWPPIYLHADGTILAKGVAQGYRSTAERARCAPPVQTGRAKSVPGCTRSAYQPSDYDTHDQNALGPNRDGSSRGTTGRFASTNNQHTDYGSTGSGYRQTNVLTTITPSGQTGTTIDWQKCQPPSLFELTYYDWYIEEGRESHRKILGDRFDICRVYREAFPKQYHR